ncbi:MAG: NADH-quinone oxidoreductase subunit N [Capsulimonadaceae bacterium]|nr:NADH-quinone oxidoreductase subunit N [Capsulimonadaceae bacterium]
MLNLTDYLSIAPFLVIALTGAAVLLFDLVFPKNKNLLIGTSLLGIVGAAFLTGRLWFQYAEGFSFTVSGDRFALLFEYVLLIIAGLSVLLSDRYLQLKNINHGEYYALLLFSTSGAMLMASAKELILIFVGLEILSIALYILAGFARTEEKSEEAAIKYLLLGAFSSAFFLYGIALIYGGTGLLTGLHGQPAPTTQLDHIASIVMLHGFNAYVVAGIALLFVGLFFKAAIVPFHVWSPDVYQGAPTCVTAFMSAAVKAAAFAVLIRITETFLQIDPSEFGVTSDVARQLALAHHVITGVLWAFAAITMIVGNVVALWQTDIKRMLAYSSVAHAGYILVGVLASNDQGRSAVLFYALIYAIMNLGAFGIVMLLSDEKQERSRIDDFKGLAYKHPFTAVLMSIFMFSLAGIPPAAGFFAKLYLFSAAVQAGDPGIAVLGLLASVVGVYYYLMVVVKMWMVPEDRDITTLTWSWGSRVAVLICASATLLLFLFASPVISTFSGSDVTVSADDYSAASAAPVEPVAPPKALAVQPHVIGATAIAQR